MNSEKWIKYGERFCNSKKIVWKYYPNKGKPFTAPYAYFDDVYDYNNFRSLTNEISIGERKVFNSQDTPLRKDSSILYYTDARGSLFNYGYFVNCGDK